MIKLCECGCGQPTKMITKNATRNGRIKGEYSRFLRGHAMIGKNYLTFAGRHHTEESKLKYKIGKNHPMYGKKHTKESIKKMRKAHKGCIGWNKGRKFPEEWRKNISKGRKGKYIGENNPNWKGGIAPLNLAIRGLAEYKQWRNTIYKRDNWTCQTCGVRCSEGKTVHLEAHHKKEFAVILIEFLKEYDQFSPFEDQHTLLRLATKYEPFWNVDNGVTLCEDCHKLTRKGKYAIR